MQKHQWREDSEDGKMVYRATQHAGEWKLYSQLIEDESAKAAKKQTEKFANDVKNSAKPDCLKNDYGLGLLNVLPMIYDIAKDRCH